MTKMLFALTLIPLSISAWSATLKDQCPDLKSCVETVSQLTGKKYVYHLQDSKPFSIDGSSNVAMTKDNADSLFSSILFMNELSRVPANDEYQIIPTRDVRFASVPVIMATSKDAPVIPNTHDYFELRYTADNPDTLKHGVSGLRPFLTRYGRVMDTSTGKIFIVVETGQTLLRLYPLLKDRDVKAGPEMKKRWEENDKRRHERDMEEAKHPRKEKEEDKK